MCCLSFCWRGGEGFVWVFMFKGFCILGPEGPNTQSFHKGYVRGVKGLRRVLGRVSMG